MTEEDAREAYWLLGTKYPEWALLNPDRGISFLMADGGEGYAKLHLPKWTPPSATRYKSGDAK